MLPAVLDDTTTVELACPRRPDIVTGTPTAIIDAEGFVVALIVVPATWDDTAGYD